MPSRRALTLLLALALLLSACAPAPAPTAAPTALGVTDAPVPTAPAATRSIPLPIATPKLSVTPLPPSPASPTPGPSPTSTALPPLKAHAFQPGWTLLQLGTLDGGRYNPAFVLYADGTLITRQCADGRCAYNLETLDRRATCAWLNRVDRLGFFGYDPATFVSPSAGPLTLIRADAWAQNAAALPDLPRWVDDPAWFERQSGCPGCTRRPAILAALADTYTLLAGYRPQVERAYIPTRLALTFSTPLIQGTAAAWPQELPAPASLLAASACPDPAQRRAVVLDGPDATRLVEWISASLAQGGAPLVTAAGQDWEISAGWLLPHQSAPGCGDAGYLPDPAEPPPTLTLSCSPADGLVDLIQ